MSTSKYVSRTESPFTFDSSIIYGAMSGSVHTGSCPSTPPTSPSPIIPPIVLKRPTGTISIESIQKLEKGIKIKNR